MKRHTPVARVTETDAGLERIKHLVEQLAAAPAHSRQQRALRTAVRIEADVYRKSLDTEQATATHDAKRPLSGGDRYNKLSRMAEAIRLARASMMTRSRHPKRRP